MSDKMRNKIKHIERYPRISVRIPLVLYDLLLKKAKKRGGKSEVVKAALECFLTNKSCQAKKK